MSILPHQIVTNSNSNMNTPPPTSSIEKEKEKEKDTDKDKESDKDKDMAKGVPIEPLVGINFQYLDDCIREKHKGT